MNEKNYTPQIYKRLGTLNCNKMLNFKKQISNKTVSKETINKVIPFLYKVKEELLIKIYQRTKSKNLKKEILTIFNFRYKGLLKSLIKKSNAVRNGEDQNNDAFTFAFMALIKALDKFKIERDIKFSTYAATIIINTLRKEMRNFYELVKIPHTTNHKYKDKTKRNHEQSRRIAYIHDIENGRLSSSDHKEKIKKSFYEFVISNSSSSQSYKEKLESSKKLLNKNELKVLNLTIKRKTQHEIANNLKVSQPRVAWLLKKTKEKIKSFGN